VHEESYCYEGFSKIRAKVCCLSITVQEKMTAFKRYWIMRGLFYCASRNKNKDLHISLFWGRVDIWINNGKFVQLNIFDKPILQSKKK